ncbi:MAG: PA14 domain-containing protein [Planctomycetota bacterium]
MCRNTSILIVLAFMLVFSGAAQAGRDITGPGDIIQGIPNDGISDNQDHGWPGNEPPHQAIDDRIDTKYLHFKGDIEPTGFRVTPAVGPTIVTGLTFTTANDAVPRDPIEYELWGSNVSIDGPYTLIAEGPIVDFADSTDWPRRTKTETPIQFQNDIAYAHYQVIFPVVRDPGGANSMQIAEVELLSPVFKASEPVPADGSVHEDTWANLGWTPGETAVSHDVYFGESFNDVDDGAEGTFQGNHTSPFLVVGFPGFAVPDGLVLGTTYYWRVDEIEADGTTIHKGDVWSFTVPPKTGYNPDPPDTAKWVDPNPTLSWSPGWGARLHYVYFGDNFNDVNNATGATQQTTTIFDPGTLELGKTYYWRVDEFDVAATHKGDVWSFTTTDGSGGIKGEYFNNIDMSGTPVLTRIDPNVNLDLGGESPGPGVSTDEWSARWTADLEIIVPDTFTFAVNCQDGTRLWIDDKLIINQWVMPTVTSKYYSVPISLEKGVHSLRLEYFDSAGDAVEQLYWSTPTMAEEIIPAGPLQPPFRANNPNPSNGSVDVKQTTILGWNAGEAAASHEVYFGNDASALEAKGSQALGSESYDPGQLEWNTAYYWRVDEVNDTNPDSPWTGAVWSFTTANFLIIDDMESYNDIEDDQPGSNRLWNAWIDGYDDPTNGSFVGHDPPPIAEQTIVHSGLQSMPFAYDNAVGKSEATLTLTSNTDWTINGVDTLGIWYIGDPAHAAETMYVILNGTASVDNPDANAAQAEDWTEWKVSLSEFGINLTNVNTITLGLKSGTGGAGMMFFDDIRLYPPAP